MRILNNSQIHINPNYYKPDETKHLVSAGFSLMTDDEIKKTNNKSIFLIESEECGNGD